MKNLIIGAAMVALSTTAMAQTSDFNYNVDRFADIEVLRYQVPGFEDLSLNQKKLVYYLQEAALQGRDILFDQNCKYNLMALPPRSSTNDKPHSFTHKNKSH